MTNQNTLKRRYFECPKGHKVSTQYPDAFTYTVWINDKEMVSSGTVCNQCMVEFYKENFGMTEIE